MSIPSRTPEKASPPSFWTNCLEVLHKLSSLLTPKRKGAVPKLPGVLISHDIARIIQVVSEDPVFSTWFLTLRSLPPENRVQELTKMADALRPDPSSEDVAAILETLKSPSIYEAFCLALQDIRDLKNA